MQLQVLMDLVHAHASSNTLDGIAQFGSTVWMQFPGLESDVKHQKNWKTDAKP